MSRPKAIDYEQQRARILRLAVDAFARIGYPSASMSGLAQACGTSKAGLYHYFPSKDALLFEALNGYTQRLQEIVNASADLQLAPREALLRTVRALMREYSSSRAYHVALLNDVKFLADPQRTQIQAQERAVVDVIADRLARAYPNAITNDNRIVVTMALLGMINFTIAWLRPDGPVSHEQFADLAVDLWSKGLDGANIPILKGPSSEQAICIEG